MHSVPFQDRLSVSVNEAVAVTGLPRSTIFALIGDGTIESCRVGRRRLVLVRSLRRLIEGDAASNDGAEAA